jgi:nicotinamidase-related amidase
MVENSADERRALLVMDVQRGIVERYGNDLGLLERINSATTAARAAGIPVIYVGVRFREGGPEISPRNRMFAGARQSTGGESNPMMDIHPTIAPQAGDVVITKKRVSAFIGSDLDVVLRSQNITSLILCGIATSGVVLSTLRYAADMDYQLAVLADCCKDNDEEVHRVLLEKVFPRQATVLTAAEWQTSLEKA